MSMSNYANHGYVVRADKLGPLFADRVEKRAEWLKQLADADENGADIESLQEYLSEHTPAGTVVPELFILNDECESIDLERGVVYAQYDEADLYELVPSRFAEGLKAVGIVPEMNQWVTFG